MSLVSDSTPVVDELSASHRTGFLVRIAVVALLSVVSSVFVIEDALAGILSGSRAVTVIVVPLLSAMIAAGYRRVPRGVSDSESDWIIGVLAGVAGLTFLALLSNRFSTMAGLWRLELVSVVVWVAATATVVFGVRYAARMWALWLFAIASASPLPFLLVAAIFGGSNLIVVAESSLLAGLAVYLATRTRPLQWRLVGGATTAMIGCGVAAAILSMWGGRYALVVATVVSATVVPFLMFSATMHLLAPVARRAPQAPVRAKFPHRSRLSIAALAVLALVVAVLYPLPSRQTGASVPGNWVARAGMVKVQDFPFISRFLGPGTTLTRFEVANQPGRPRVAVDVIESRDPGPLGDFRDALWYPVDHPINYRAESVSGVPVRTTYTESDAAVTGDVRDWYALTWTWHTPRATQQVIVVVAAQRSGTPPDPEPLTLTGTASGAAVWVARQQPDPVNHVDERVSAAAHQAAQQLIAAAGAANG